MLYITVHELGASSLVLILVMSLHQNQHLTISSKTYQTILTTTNDLGYLVEYATGVTPELMPLTTNNY